MPLSYIIRPTGNRGVFAFLGGRSLDKGSAIGESALGLGACEAIIARVRVQNGAMLDAASRVRLEALDARLVVQADALLALEPPACCSAVAHRSGVS